MANIRTHYDNLRVARNAPDSVIKAAYKALSQTYHPDKFQGNKAEAERIMKLINTSYTVLIDPVKRAEHDVWIKEKEAAANQQYEKASFAETGSGTEQEFYQKQETKREYTPPPREPEPEPPKADTSLYLWRRYFARQIDYIICAFLLSFILAAWSATGQSLPNTINEAINNPNLSVSQQMINWSIVSTFFWVILEPICLSMFGTTLGKALFRLRLVSDNIEPKYWERSIAVWLQGMGGGLPVISAFFMLNAAAKLKKNGQTEWDRRTGFSVEAEPLGILRSVSLTVLIVLVFVGSSILGEIGKHTKPSQQPIQQTQVVRSVPQATPVKDNKMATNPNIDFNNINPLDISYEGYEHLFKPEEKPVASQATTGNTGCIGNCINGQGTLTYTSGDKYVGQFKNGQPDGQGTLIYVNGNKYAGEFRNNAINGQGTVTYANGDKYEGIMTNGMREGQGILTYANGTKVTGEWKNDQFIQATPSRKGMFDEFLPKQSSAKPTGKAPVLPTKEERAGTGMFDEFLQPSQQAPLQRADDLYDQGRYAEALPLYQGLAEQGNTEAQINLGSMYEKGQGVTQDYTQTISWYRKAADQGSYLGQYNLGIMYGTGRGVALNYVQAAYWYRKSADQGYAYAQNNLGVMYNYGRGVTQDYNQSVYWYRKAAEQGNANAIATLKKLGQ